MSSPIRNGRVSSILRAVTAGDVVFARRDRAAYIRPTWQPSRVAFLETELGEDYVFSHFDSNIPPGTRFFKVICKNLDRSSQAASIAVTATVRS